MVTGGCGFIGTNLVSTLKQIESLGILNVDKISYASNKLHTKDSANYQFIKCDVNDKNNMKTVIQNFAPDIIFHLAADTHVDNSINDASPFIKSNICGTFTLLELVRDYYMKLHGSKREIFRFIHVSTDEIYGSLDLESESFSENSNIEPNSPYSSSKAASDLLVRAWNKTYKLPTIITNCSNNYGPFQNNEKLIPKMVFNLITGQPIPIYGLGQQIRDWLYVSDHVDALIKIANSGKTGERYNIGSQTELKNITVAEEVCDAYDFLMGLEAKTSRKEIHFVEDRLGHDYRYSIDSSKLQTELNWEPKREFKEALLETIENHITDYHSEAVLIR